MARISDTQKLKQKSQSNNWEISFGALITISSRMPNLPKSIITNAAVNEDINTKKQNNIIKYTVDIIL